MQAELPAPSIDDRLETLDVLRGFALLGMLLVHWTDHAADGQGLSRSIQTAIGLFVSERAYATFAMLFGASFALQAARARRRGTPFTGVWLRRLAILAVFGTIAHGGFGYNVLLTYALWGIPLLLLDRLPTRILLPMAVICSFAWPLYFLVRGSIEWLTIGAAASDASYAAWRSSTAAAWDLLGVAREQSSFFAALPYRAAHMAWFYVQAWMFLPGQLEMFLAGLLAFRHGFLVEPRRHTRAIVVLMTIGVVAWGTQWLPVPSFPAGTPERIVRSAAMLSRGHWLMLTWVGTALLLLAHVPASRRWLMPFAAPGRTALSNYFAQIITLDLLLSRYGVGLNAFPAWSILPGSLTLFAILLFLSHLWLTYFQFGPVEWIWRSATYGRLVPMRIRADPVATAT
jgi:uncharacterized protein